MRGRDPDALASDSGHRTERHSPAGGFAHWLRTAPHARRRLPWGVAEGRALVNSGAKWPSITGLPRQRLVGGAQVPAVPPSTPAAPAPGSRPAARALSRPARPPESLVVTPAGPNPRDSPTSQPPGRRRVTVYQTAGARRPAD